MVGLYQCTHKSNFHVCLWRQMPCSWSNLTLNWCGIMKEKCCNLILCGYTWALTLFKAHKIPSDEQRGHKIIPFSHNEVIFGWRPRDWNQDNFLFFFPLFFLSLYFSVQRRKCIVSYVCLVDNSEGGKIRYTDIVQVCSWPIHNQRNYIGPS